MTRLLFLENSRERGLAATNLARFYSSPAEVQIFQPFPEGLHPSINSTFLCKRYIDSWQASYAASRQFFCALLLPWTLPQDINCDRRPRSCSRCTQTRSTTSYLQASCEASQHFLAHSSFLGYRHKYHVRPPLWIVDPFSSPTCPNKSPTIPLLRSHCYQALRPKQKTQGREWVPGSSAARGALPPL